MFARNEVLMPIRGYLLISTVACVCALVFSGLYDGGPVPVLGDYSLPLATLCAALVGLPALISLPSRIMDGFRPVPAQPLGLIALFGLSALLTIPPVMIDIFTRFPHDINVLPPESLLFYPAIALVAEVVFHLIPLAVFSILASSRTPPGWVFLLVIFVEPIFQAVLSYDAGLQAWLVFGNVSLISAAQIWLFRRYGFNAMFALRLAYYFFWHVVWGSARLSLLF